MRVSIAFLVVLLFVPILAFGFQADEVEPSTMQYIALVFNVGIIGALLQLVKWRLLPILKESAPYTIPLIGMAIGMASTWVMQMTGIDISPIGNIFETGIMSGALASTGFVVVKEFDNKVLKRL